MSCMWKTFEKKFWNILTKSRKHIYCVLKFYYFTKFVVIVFIKETEPTKLPLEMNKPVLNQAINALIGIKFKPNRHAQWENHHGDQTNHGILYSLATGGKPRQFKFPRQ